MSLITGFEMWNEFTTPRKQHLMLWLNKDAFDFLRLPYELVTLIVLPSTFSASTLFYNAFCAGFLYLRNEIGEAKIEVPYCTVITEAEECKATWSLMQCTLVVIGKPYTEIHFSKIFLSAITKQTGQG